MRGTNNNQKKQNYEYIEIRLQEPAHDGAPDCRQTGEIRPRGIYFLGREHVDACLHSVGVRSQKRGKISTSSLFYFITTKFSEL